MPFSKVEILRAACCVAGHNGEIIQAELDMLQKLAYHAGVGAASLNAMMERARTDPKFYREQFRLISNCGDEAIKILFLVALADHDLSDREIRMLWHFARKLNITEQRFRQLYATARRQVQQQPPPESPPPEAPSPEVSEASKLTPGNPGTPGTPGIPGNPGTHLSE